MFLSVAIGFLASASAVFSHCNPTTKTCSIVSDPMVTAFDGETYNFDVSGWFDAISTEEMKISINIAPAPDARHPTWSQSYIHELIYTCGSDSETFTVDQLKSSGPVYRSCNSGDCDSATCEFHANYKDDPVPCIELTKVNYSGSKAIDGLCYYQDNSCPQFPVTTTTTTTTVQTTTTTTVQTATTTVPKTTTTTTTVAIATTSTTDSTGAPGGSSSTPATTIGSVSSAKSSDTAASTNYVPSGPVSSPGSASRTTLAGNVPSTTFGTSSSGTGGSSAPVGSCTTSTSAPPSNNTPSAGAPASGGGIISIYTPGPGTAASSNARYVPPPTTGAGYGYPGATPPSPNKPNTFSTKLNLYNSLSIRPEVSFLTISFLLGVLAM